MSDALKARIAKEMVKKIAQMLQRSGPNTVVISHKLSSVDI